MTPRACQPTTPPMLITSPIVACDYLLEARKCVQTVQESTLAGTALYNACNQILPQIDAAIAGLRRAK